MLPKTKICIYFFLLSTTFAVSQSKEYASSLTDFQTHYNNEDMEAVYDMFNNNMQKAVSLAKITQLLDTYHTYFGTITHYEFEESTEVVEKHIVHFENGKRYVSIALDAAGRIGGLLFKPFEEHSEPKFTSNSTTLQLPFKGEWFTYWGGDNKRQNYHVINKSQQGAFDFIILDKNDRSYARSGTRNEDYYAFGKPIYAVCDAEVVQVITGVEDNRPTIMNPAQSLGNSVVLKTANNEFIYYAHFEKETIKVQEGQVVKKGQYLGNCGNSGNSSEPHLHLHIQDELNPLTAHGAVCNFEKLIVNGQERTNYSPVKGDRISMPQN